VEELTKLLTNQLRQEQRQKKNAMVQMQAEIAARQQAQVGANHPVVLLDFVAATFLAPLPHNACLCARSQRLLPPSSSSFTAVRACPLSCSNALLTACLNVITA
jgi:hypothetical protein